MLALQALLVALVLSVTLVSGGADGPASHCLRGNKKGFLCPVAGRCVDPSRVCDGILDCWDRFDERDCDSCRGGAVRCGGGNSTEVRCVAAIYVCDGTPDCLDAEDEEDCLGDYSDLYSCLDGSKRKQQVVCDGIQDCVRPDDDEGACTRCQEDALLCDGWCLQAARRCDGVRDCKDGSDEVCEDADESVPGVASQAVVLPSHPAYWMVGGALLVLILVVVATAIFIFMRTQRPRASVHFERQMDSFGETPFVSALDNVNYGLEVVENVYEEPIQAGRH